VLLGVDPIRTPAELIAARVEQAVAGQGASPPQAPKSALVLAAAPGCSPTVAPEVKHFLDSRKPARLHTLQVLLVLRAVGA
jgi:hypothetical protein